jgi:hypothetical protein
MVDDIESSLKVEKDNASNAVGFEEGMEDSSISTCRVVTAESGLCRLHLSLACSIEPTEKQALEDLLKHTNQSDRSNIISILRSGVILNDQADHAIVLDVRCTAELDAGVKQGS